MSSAQRAAAVSQHRPRQRWIIWPAASGLLPTAYCLLPTVVVLALALWLRLVGITKDTDISDEGIRGLQLRLMAAGFRPVTEIYASQGPLSLAVFYPLYALFGGDIVAARLAVVVYSLAGIAGVYWLGRELDSARVGLAAAAILAVSPIYLENSRLAFVEVPSLVPAVLAVCALARYRRGGGQIWLVGSALLLALGVLAKPMAAVAGAAALVLILVRKPNPAKRTCSPAPFPKGKGELSSPLPFREGGPGGLGLSSRLTDLLIFGAVGLLGVGVVVALAGPAQIYEQVIGYRLAARAARGWELAANWGLVRSELGREGIGLVLAAGVGAAALARRRPILVGSLVAWLGAALGLMLLYSPLWPKHLVYVMPPLALLTGVALVDATRAARGLLQRGEGLSALGVASMAASVVYLGGGPGIVAQDNGLISRSPGDDAERYADDVRLARAVAGPSDFIVMDDAYLALATGRLVPPYLADLSWNRILARALTAEQAIAETQRFGARVLVVQDEHLGQLPRYLAFADRNYLLVKSYVQRRPNRFRRVYVRPDVDLAAARAALSGGIQTSLRAEIGPAALLGYSIDRAELKPGLRFALTLHWEALVSSPPDHHVVLRLRGPDGRAVQESDWRVGDGPQELPTWTAGRWQFQTVRVQVDNDVSPGAYTLTLALERPNGGPAPIHAGPGSTLAALGDQLDLGTITVR